MSASKVLALAGRRRRVPVLFEVTLALYEICASGLGVPVPPRLSRRANPQTG